MKPEPLEQMLSGGHPNSLGRTEEVVDLILNDQSRLEELYQCYFSDDEVVRLRVSSALKRITAARPAWLVPYIDRLIETISQIDQPSTQWTLALLFDMLKPLMSDTQKAGALAVMQHNVAHHHDWIVLHNNMQTIFDWGQSDPTLHLWLKPHLERLKTDRRKSVAKRAHKLYQQLQD